MLITTERVVPTIPPLEIVTIVSIVTQPLPKQFGTKALDDWPSCAAVPSAWDQYVASPDSARLRRRQRDLSRINGDRSGEELFQ
jgi:hypothetical protein